MRHAPFILLGVLLVALSVTAQASAEPAKYGLKPPVLIHLAPPIPCTSANRMDIFVDEDNILWACECEMLRTGNICRWQVIGGVDPVASRKHAKKKHPKRVVAYSIAPILIRVHT